VTDYWVLDLAGRRLLLFRDQLPVPVPVAELLP
jgi:hypothetical protein